MYCLERDYSVRDARRLGQHGVVAWFSYYRLV